MDPLFEGIQTPEIDHDNWHAVTDTKKRKQIQDRLAQRARRKRLRDAQKRVIDVKNNSRNTTNADSNCNESQALSSQVESCELVQFTSDITALESTSHISSTQPSPSISYEVHYPITVFGALYINGQILGLSCNSSSAAKSQPPSAQVPIPLHPTNTQLLTVHYQWIDRFPFPEMRDNLINMTAFVDEEEFITDIFTKPSFSLTPGTVSWDPRGWKAEKNFREKWGFLFSR